MERCKSWVLSLEIFVKCCLSQPITSCKRQIKDQLQTLAPSTKKSTRMQLRQFGAGEPPNNNMLLRMQNQHFG